MRRLAWLPLLFVFVTLSSVGLSGGPAEAWGLCPNCLGQSRSFTTTLELIGTFLLLPFVIAVVAIRKIRRLCGPPAARSTVPATPSSFLPDRR